MSGPLRDHAPHWNSGRPRHTILKVARRSPLLLAPEALFEYAVEALARRALTTVELRTRLERRAARSRDVDEVIERLSAVGYLDDFRAAESHSHVRKEFEALGPKRVVRELLQRGVDASVAEEAVGEVYHDTNETDLIHAHLQKKLGKHYREHKIDDPRVIVRVYRGLLRAGFPGDRIVDALREISSDNEWLDGFADDPGDEDLEM